MTYGVAGVTVRFAGRTALADVSLDAQAGTVTAVVGGDGSGKTTLLRVLVGLLRPQAGTVRRPSTADIGYFSAASGVYDDLTVEENLDFTAAAYRVRDLRRRDDLLDTAGLADTRQLLGGQLSGGMRHKLGLVMAMLHQPTLLVLDEPGTGVDPVSRAELSRLIVRAAAAGTTVVISTSYLDEAERANQVLVLDEGHVLRSGAPEDIVQSVPGTVVASAHRLDQHRSWRRGAGWHTWIAPGCTCPDDVRQATVDLEDAAVVAALERSA